MGLAVPFMSTLLILLLPFRLNLYFQAMLYILTVIPWNFKDLGIVLPMHNYLPILQQTSEWTVFSNNSGKPPSGLTPHIYACY